MAELLVQPYIQQDQQRADSFFGLLSSQTRLTWIPVDLPVADATARLRAKYRLKTPDAVQAATTIIGGATALITNDRIFERVTEFETIVLDQYL